MNIWPWSTIARLRRELESVTWRCDMHKSHLNQYIAERDEAIRQRDGARKERGNAIVALSDQGDVLHAAHVTILDLRAQLAAKIGMGSAYNPDNPPPGVSDAASRPVFPTPPKVSRPKRVRK